MRGNPTSEKTIARIRKLRAAGFGVRTIVKMCRCSSDTVVKVTGRLEPEERARRAAVARWPNGAKPKAEKIPRVPKPSVPRIPRPRVPKPSAEIPQMKSVREIPELQTYIGEDGKQYPRQRAVVKPAEGEITLTAAQRKNSLGILNRLAGEQIEEPKTRRKRLSDEMADERRELADYIPRGLEITDEMIKAAHASVDWKDMRRATKNARARLRDEIQAGFERIAARAAYVRGGHSDSRQRPRANGIFLGVAA